jgi:Domain of unknown function (DUF4055)
MPERKQSPVESTRVEVINSLDKWSRIRAAVEGEEAIKQLGEAILPKPNPTDTSKENAARFQAYLQRAVWYNVSGRTLAGLTGFVFRKDPVIELPELLKPMLDNVDGSGVTMVQQAKAALRSVLAFGRAGLLSDYPHVEGATTQQDILDGRIAPTIVLYQPEQITNWFVSFVGAKAVLDLLVLRENYTVPVAENEFQMQSRIQYRVLTRTPEGVTGRIYREEGSEPGFKEQTQLSYVVTDKAGKPLPEIPFTFLGAVNNDPEVDGSPLLDLVNLNIAHFRNSADHEESCFIVGQPTPWASGLTEQWVKEVMHGQLHLGSRAVIPLPQGGAAGLLQANPNTMPFEAMKHKELQMVALGAKLVEQKDVQRTATEASMDQASETSTLTAAATNVFQGYRRALTFCGLFVGAETVKLGFDLSEPLTRDVITPEQATAIATAWMQGLVDYEEARAFLKAAGWAWKDDKEVKDNNAAEDFNRGSGLPTPPGAPKPPAPKPAPQPPAPQPAKK